MCLWEFVNISVDISKALFRVNNSKHFFFFILKIPPVRKASVPPWFKNFCFTFLTYPFQCHERDISLRNIVRIFYKVPSLLTSVKVNFPAFTSQFMLEIYGLSATTIWQAFWWKLSSKNKQPGKKQSVS